jgi:hypothetical protein
MQKLGEVYKHMNLKLVSSELFVRSCERFSHSTQKKNVRGVRTKYQRIDKNLHENDICRGLSDNSSQAGPTVSCSIAIWRWDKEIEYYS